MPETSQIGDGIKRSLRKLDNDFYSAGKRWGREAKRGIGEEIELDIDADTTKAKRKIRELDSTVKRSEHKVKVDADTSSFNKVATLLRNVQTNFTAFAIAGASVPNTIASVGGAVAQLSGVIGLMPAGINAAALAFGSLKVATLGFGDAMKEVGDPAKFGEAIKQLSPNAQEAARAIQGLMPQINQLKMTVQDAFFAGLGDQFKQLGSTYVPMFQTAMSQVAASANTAFQTVGSMMQQGPMKADMQTMLGNMTSSINVLSQALAPVVKAFVDIGLVGSGFLPQLAASATQAATAFAGFMQNARESGDLQGWIQTGIDAMKQLFDIIGNVGSAIMGIMKAAPPGGGLLGTLASLTQMLTDFINSPAGQGALTAFMTTMKQTMGALMPAVGALLQALAPVLGLLGQFSGLIIQSVAPALQTWFEAMTPVIQQVVGALHPVMAALQPVLQQVAQILAQQMVNGINTLLPLLIPFVQQMGQLLVAALPLIPPMVQLATVLIPLFQQYLSLLLPVLTKFAEALTIQANTVLPVMAEQMGLVANAFQTFGNVLGAVGTVLEAVGQKIENFMNGPVGKVLGFLAGPLPRMVSMVASLPGGGTAPPMALPTPAFGNDIRPGAQRERRGAPPLAPAVPLPAAPIPPISTYVAPPVSSGGGGGGGGTTPAALSPTGVDWEAVAQAESSGNWAINTGNGYYGGLQFDLPTWQQFGGTEFAPRPDLASKEQQIIVAERVPTSERYTRWPNTYSKGAKGRPPAGSAAAAASSGTTASPYSPAMPSGAPAGFDEALLSQVPAGRYDPSGDLAQGLGDCSSAVEDLVNMLQGRPTAGREMSTANAAQWLTAHGFVQGNMPGAFNVGFSSSHMEATLPGGTNFNWGSAEAAARGGRGGQGAASFPSQYYLPVSGGMDTSGMGMAGLSGNYAADKTLREAQQKVADTDQAIRDAEEKLNKLRMKPGATPEEIAKQERAVAKAKREHTDATNDLAAAQGKYNKAAGESPDKGGFSGQDFMAGIAEFFGFDGSLFKNPAEFGLIKFLGGMSKLKMGSSQDPTMSDTGGGGGIVDSLLSNIPSPFGPLNIGSPQDMPGQFMPQMPSADTSVAPFGQVGAPGTAGPGNQPIDNSININNPMGQDHFNGMVDAANSVKYPRQRQPLRALPGGGP